MDEKGIRYCGKCNKPYAYNVYTCPDCGMPTEKAGFIRLNKQRKYNSTSHTHSNAEKRSFPLFGTICFVVSLVAFIISSSGLLSLFLSIPSIVFGIIGLSRQEKMKWLCFTGIALAVFASIISYGSTLS